MLAYPARQGYNSMFSHLYWFNIMSFSTSNCSLPPSAVADQIPCLICAFSSHHRVPSDAQLIRRDQLYSHIADHLNYRDGANAYMDILCNMTFGHCVQIDFAKRLNQLPKGRAARTGGNSGASPMQISLNDIPSSSILSSLSSIPSNLLSSPVIRTTTTFPSSSSVVQLPLTPIPLAAREGPSENDTQQTVEQSTKTEELLNGSHELKVERNSGINNNNNNEEDAVQYFNNLPNESQLSLPDFEMDTERAENTAAQKRRRKQSMTNSSTPRAKKRRKSVTTNKEVEALNNWTMLVSPRSNRKCKTVASKNISKTFTSARRPIVAKNGASAFQMKGASVLRSAAWKGNGQQRQSDRTLERQSDRTLERQSDRTLERQSDRTLERQSDRTLEERMPKNAYFDCTCKEPLGINKFIVGCSQCRRWFHGKCVRISQRESKRIPFWQCAECKELQNTEERNEGEIQLMFCVCRRPYDNERFYVGCDGCGDWYHPECVNTTEENALSGECYSCPDCKKKPQKWFDAKMMVTTKTEANG